MKASLEFDLDNPKQKEQYDAYFRAEKMRLALIAVSCILLNTH